MWGVSESVRTHWYFAQASKILLDPPLTHSLIHAVYTHACTCAYTHKPFIGLNSASVWSVSISLARTRHHSSCILTSIQSNTGRRDWAGTLLHGDDCYHGNCGGVRPSNKPGNVMLPCFLFPWENINFVLVHVSPCFFLSGFPHVEECMYLSLSLTILGACG